LLAISFNAILLPRNSPSGGLHEEDGTLAKYSATQGHTCQCMWLWNPPPHYWLAP